MAWTKQQRKAHGLRMKEMWAKKAAAKEIMKRITADVEEQQNQWKHDYLRKMDLPGNKYFDSSSEEFERWVKTDDPQDVVNHPSHYTSHPSGIECIQVTEHMNFCRGNAIKYIWRAGDKGDEVEDLKKAVWYLQREIERITK